MRYRRSKQAGASYFFTVNLADRHADHLTRNITLLRETIRRVMHAHPFTIDAMVVLPEHLHAIWTLPADDAAYPARWSLIKAGFSRDIASVEEIKRSRRSKRERGIWQRRYWEHQLRDDRDFAAHVDYIHFNPVKHGYARSAVDWPYSSIHRFVESGLLDASWAVDPDVQGEFGEL